MRRLYLWLPLTPAFVFCAGFMMNALVIGLNHGQMPVLGPGCLASPDDLWHTCMVHGTHLKPLADWILLHDAESAGVMSPGDVLLIFAQSTFWYALVAWAALVIRELQEPR